MAASNPRWRVSVATLDRVVFQGTRGAPQMLILERTATLGRDKAPNSSIVWAKPFGGAVHILDVEALRQQIGDFEFDSQRSRSEQDFRILVPAVAWDKVKQFCLLHLVKPDDAIIETSPQRELAEEFMDALRINLEPGQVFSRTAGFVVENTPAPTGNLYGPGVPTVRIYHIFEVNILESSIRTALLENSNRYSDLDLQAMVAADAVHGGKGRANAALALQLHTVINSYLKIPLLQRAKSLTVDGHLFETSVIAVLENVDAPQYERLSK